jgi:hypothetical protein
MLTREADDVDEAPRRQQADSMQKSTRKASRACDPIALFLNLRVSVDFQVPLSALRSTQTMKRALSVLVHQLAPSSVGAGKAGMRVPSLLVAL